MLACQQSGWRQPCAGGCHVTALPNMKRAHTTALLTPHPSLAQDLGQLSPGKRLCSSFARTARGLGVWSWWGCSGRCQNLLGQCYKRYLISRAWSISQPSQCSGSAHCMPQLGAGSGADRSWEERGTEAAQISGGSMATSVPTGTTP